MSFYWNIFNLLDGEKPHVRTAEQRRAVDVDSLLKEVFPEIAKLQNEFIKDGGEIKEEYFESSRGLKLFSRTYVPGKSPRGAVLICHGYTDDIQWNNRKTCLKYAELGYLVTAVEMEGHGFSDGLSSLLPDFKGAVSDAHEYLKKKKNEYPGLKWLVHGESMGGMFALNLILLEQEHGTPFEGAVLIAPMCKIADKVKPPDAVIKVLLFLAKYFPSLSATPSDMDDSLVFKDKAFLEKANKNPIKYSGRPRLATAAELFTSTVEMEKRMTQVKTPFIVMHGTADVVTTPEASQELYDAVSLPQSDRTLVLLEGQWHGILWAEAPEDIEKNWETFLNWAQSRV